MKDPTRILMVATSYPRSEDDWQGLFIRRITDAMARNPDISLSIWAPDGPRHHELQYACTTDDARWLDVLAREGGLAHLLRKRPLYALFRAAGLLKRLRRLYRQQRATTDIFHINWLQNALALYGMNVAAVITVLGTDFKLLKLPGMAWMLRAVLKTNRCVLAPNAQWMEPELRRLFGDVADIVPVNFGIDDSWYSVPYHSPQETNNWLIVVRVTKDKMGRLFEWGEGVFGDKQRLHLFGPNQESLDIPEWVDYHGPATAQELLDKWYPKCSGFITLSEHSEGKPQVLLETMAAGMPIIASGIPAHRDTIVHGQHGYLVETREQFIKALEDVSNGEKHRQMSSSARQTSKQDYGNWDDCVNRYQQLFGSLE